MISRRTANLIGQSYSGEFAGQCVYRDSLYDFLFDHDYSVWFCNSVKKLFGDGRSVQEHVMRLHTGETLAAATTKWSWEQRRQLGQTYLEKLGCDILNKEIDYDPRDRKKTLRRQLLATLELDGYQYRNNRLISSETDILETQEVSGVLSGLFGDLNLNNIETAMHCLKLSEDHWLNGKWDDCISNARRFLEATMQEVAAAYALRVKRMTLDDRIFSRPVKVREYLESEGLLERQEMAAIKETYGFLSGTGSHPYIAAKDQARLLRQIALLYAQFVMLRLQGSLASHCSPPSASVALTPAE